MINIYLLVVWDLKENYGNFSVGQYIQKLN